MKPSEFFKRIKKKLYAQKHRIGALSTDPETIEKKIVRKLDDEKKGKK